jgi:hypothetical protein
MNISANQIAGSVPRFQALPALVALALHSNKLLGSFPAAALSSALPGLRVLSVHSNRALWGCLPAAWKGRVELLDAETGDYTSVLTKGALKGTALTGWC